MVAVCLAAQVPFDRIRHADSEAQNWLTYSGNYSAHRFSPLNQITPANVGKLRPVWTYQAPNQAEFETSPIVVDGVMYLTEAPMAVAALDARTGRQLWKWQLPIPRDLRTLGFAPVNRGVAILDDTVFAGTLDSHLVALDRALVRYAGTL